MLPIPSIPPIAIELHSFASTGVGIGERGLPRTTGPALRRVVDRPYFTSPLNTPTLQPPPVLAPIAPNPVQPPVVGPTHLVPLPYPGLLHQRPAPSLPSGFVMTIAKNNAAAAGGSAPIDQPQQVPARLASCWNVPAGAPSNAEITVRLAFSRAGAIVGKPRVTYVQAGNSAGAKEALVQSMLSALKACTPLPFTAGLGSAIAGYPFAIRFVAANR